MRDDYHNHDVKHHDKLTIKIKNGKFENQTTTVDNTYAASKADTDEYKANERVFLHIDDDLDHAYITEKKRDTVVVVITGLFLLSLLIVGRGVGLQSILSLILNTGAVMVAIAIHNHYSGVNLFFLMSCAIIVATVLTLLLVTGFTTRTLVTIVGTLLGTFLCVGIAAIVIHYTEGRGIKYETLNFLTLPPKDVFLASVLVGTLGAVMDVAITMSSGMHEIFMRAPHITMKRWARAGRNIGQDIMGTMTNILLFSYLAGSLPILLVFLKNSNTLTYTISMNWSLEIARAITGGIGIVLTIPITIALMQLWAKWGGAKS